MHMHLLQYMEVNQVRVLQSIKKIEKKTRISNRFENESTPLRKSHVHALKLKTTPTKVSYNFLLISIYHKTTRGFGHV